MTAEIVEQGLRPDGDNELQCRYTKVELDGSDCSTELLQNNHTESNHTLHNEDNGDITHVDIAVKQISEGSSSTGCDDGTRLLNCSRRTLKTLLIAAAVCSLGIIILVIAVYLLGRNSKQSYASSQNHSTYPKVISRSISVEGRARFTGGSFTSTDDLSIDDGSLSNFIATSFQFQLDSIFKDSDVRNIYRSIDVASVSDDHLAVTFAVNFRRPQDVTRQMLQDIRNVIVDTTKKDGTFGIFIFDRESIDIFLPDKHADMCEEVEQAFVEVSGCTSMPYNLTTYPNVLGHLSQMAALDEGYTTLAVLEERCYEFMQVYWCITFTPPCVDGRMIPPCRQFCRNAKAKCGYVPESQLLWAIGCERLPDSDNPSVCVQEPRAEAPPRCEKITSQECQTTGYSTTVFPNMAGHHSQEWSRNYLYDVELLADKFRCYDLVALFGCSVLNPKCVESDRGVAAYIPPCKTLCLEAKRHCGFFYEMLNARWASDVDCNLLPDSTDENVCVGGLEVREHVEHKGCKTSQIACDSNQCIPHAWVCDGVRDCVDNTDETNCAVCGSGFQCGDYKCLNKSRVCNGVRDCVNGEDEQHCIRLQESADFEGLLEVYDGATDQWYMVCNEHWRRAWSDEACMDLYHRKSDGMSYKKISKHRTSMAVSSTSPEKTLLQRLARRSTCSSGRAVYTSCGKFESPQCGIGDDWPPSGDESNFSGFDIAAGVWPWLVSISGGPADTFFCGGALLNSEWVLTAAHCIGHKRNASGLKASVGFTRMAPRAEYRQTRTVRELKRHPAYNWMNSENDVALLRLETPVELNRYVGTVCLLSSERDLVANKNCYVAGWGKTHTSDDDYSSVARMRAVEVVPKDACRRDIEDKYGDDTRVSTTNICARGVNGPDACAGDSGGVLACTVGNKTNVWTAAGIVSWGVECDSADWGVPGVYTDITKVRQWITNVIDDADPR